MSILKKPLVTEKVSALNEAGKYGFIVDQDGWLVKTDEVNALLKKYEESKARKEAA